MGRSILTRSAAVCCAKDAASRSLPSSSSCSKLFCEIATALVWAEDPSTGIAPAQDINALYVARAANNLALTWLEVGEFGHARPVFEVALAAARSARDKYLEGLSLHYLGETALRTGELAHAKECLTQSLALCESLSNRPLAARTQLLRGEVASSENNFAEALSLQRAALKDLSEIEDTQGIATALEALACTFAEEGRSP